jgi:glutamyl-tRNA reductase
MNIFCTGINHRTAPIDIREQLWFSPEEARKFLVKLRQQSIAECVLISTCNRTELFYVTKDSSSDIASLWRSLAAFKGIDGKAQEDHFYTLTSLHAVRHLLKLASGIDSMVLGDVQVLNQIKNSYTLAQEAGCTGTILHRVFEQALHMGKRARTETEIGEGAVSVGYASAELAAKIFGDLSERTALLIGAGETGELTAKHLHGNNLKQLFITNRTHERAVELSNRLTATPVDYNSFRQLLPEVDIVITSVATDDHILTSSDFRYAMKARNNRPLVVIDLGVPRNVDPTSSSIDNLFLHDIDGLQHIVTQNLSRRKKEISGVQRIILQELIQFEQWEQSRALTPTLQDLQRRFEEIRSLEVERVHARFSPDVNEEVTMITKRIINKILHTPMANIRSGSRQKEMQKVISQLRFLFGLDTPSV